MYQFGTWLHTRCSVSLLDVHVSEWINRFGLSSRMGEKRVFNKNRIMKWLRIFDSRYFLRFYAAPHKAYGSGYWIYKDDALTSWNSAITQKPLFLYNI